MNQHNFNRMGLPLVLFNSTLAIGGVSCSADSLRMLQLRFIIKNEYVCNMKIDELNESKVPIIVFDKKLEKLRGKVLFPEKLARANAILAKTGLPKIK